MDLVAVLPATKLPLSAPQRYIYSVTHANVGQLVQIQLGRRSLLGAVTAIGQQKPRGFVIKQAEVLPERIPLAYLHLVALTAHTYRLSEGLVLKLLLSGYSNASQEEARLSNPINIALPELTADQQSAYKQISASQPHKERRFLLRGVTGSGKTEVYAHLIRDVLKYDGQSLVLVPEIAIATQLVQRLKRYFGDSVFIWHSARSKVERHMVWKRAMRGDPIVVLGPRSALWVPLPKLALIVMDEEHDGAYKQWDQEPRFHARVVASLLAGNLHCPLVLGSATPSIETLYSTQKGTTQEIFLTQRYSKVAPPSIELIDRTGTPPDETLSPASSNAISTTLHEGKQVLVLLNRRGTAPLVVCNDCGYTWRCAHCDRTLVWHTVPSSQLSCHFCNQVQPAPTTCPDCSGSNVHLRGMGTQRVERDIRRAFPDAHVARLDADVSRKPKQLKKITEELVAGKIDILIGTQLIAKGWDLDNATLVVALNADQGLLTPDFRAHERTVQLLWQVAGRAGRRSERGRVLIETTQPQHPALQAVARQDYQGFMYQELRERKRFGYPPYRHAVTLRKKGVNTESLRQLISSLTTKNSASEPGEILPAQTVILPRGATEQHVVVLTEQPQDLYKKAPISWEIDLDPESITS